MASPNKKQLTSILNLSKFLHDQTVVLLDKLNGVDDERLDDLISEYEALEATTQRLFGVVTRQVAEIAENPAEVE